MVATEQHISSLLEGCLRNDRKSQELLYRRFYDFAMVIAMRYSRDTMDAADIMSHAFVKIFKSIRSFDATKGTLHAWIKRIVMNEGLDHIKSRERFSKDVELESISTPVIDNHALESLGAEEIMKLVQALPPATHAVFVLFAVEGFSHREIGERLGISEGTSKWHLSEARKNLQLKIEQLTTG